LPGNWFFLHQIRAACRGWVKGATQLWGLKKIEYRQERTFHLFEMPRIIFFSLFLVIDTPMAFG